jgi:murein tripeptide amidase MpaA
LPNKTWEKRLCHALKIGKGAGKRPGIYFLGGVHSREWGSPDILINFGHRLTDTFRTNSGITIGSQSFTKTQIQKLVKEKDVYIFPQANPDGRHYSMTKGRCGVRTAGRGHGGALRRRRHQPQP